MVNKFEGVTLTTPLKRIVIVGGGAGGLEMATQLGKKLGRKKKAKIILAAIGEIEDMMQDIKDMLAA